jgi:hypothetical protein
MEKLLLMFEDLWVAVTFAEAGVFEAVRMNGSQSVHQDAVRVHAV